MSGVERQKQHYWNIVQTRAIPADGSTTSACIAKSLSRQQYFWLHTFYNSYIIIVNIEHD